MTIHREFHDRLPDTHDPVYSIGDTRIEDYRRYHAGFWTPVPALPNGRIYLDWYERIDPRMLREVLKDARSTAPSGVLFIVTQELMRRGTAHDGLWYRMSLLHHQHPFWEPGVSSEPPTWLQDEPPPVVRRTAWERLIGD